MVRQILVEGEKTFIIEVPDDAHLTFGPWSPPTDKTRNYGDAALRGTLRVYQGSKTNGDILAVFSGVRGYRDITKISYKERVAVEEGATMWKSDKNGYERTERMTRNYEFEEEEHKLIASPRDAKGRFVKQD